MTSLVQLDLSLWTNPQGRVESRPDGGPPPWVSITTETDQIATIDSPAIGVHFEHLDRNHYFLGLFIRNDHWMINFAGAGYLKLAPSVRSTPERLHIRLEANPDMRGLREALATAIRVEPARLEFVQSIPVSPPHSMGRTIPVAVARDSGPLPLVLAFDSTEQGLPVVARLARALGCRAMLFLGDAGPPQALVTTDGSILEPFAFADYY